MEETETMALWVKEVTRPDGFEFNEDNGELIYKKNIDNVFPPENPSASPTLNYMIRPWMESIMEIKIQATTQVETRRLIKKLGKKRKETHLW